MLMDIPASYRARAFRDRRQRVNDIILDLTAIAAERRTTLRRAKDADNRRINDWLSTFHAARSKSLSTRNPATPGPVGLNSEPASTT